MILSHPQNHLYYLHIFPLNGLFSPLNKLGLILRNTTPYVLYRLSLFLPNTHEKEQVGIQRKFHGSLWNVGREPSHQVLTHSRHSENVSLFSLGQLSWNDYFKNLVSPTLLSTSPPPSMPQKEGTSILTQP